MKSVYAALSRLEENPPETIVELRALEANCAASYFRSWVGMPINGAAQAAGQSPRIGISLDSVRRPIIWRAIAMRRIRSMQY